MLRKEGLLDFLMLTKVYFLFQSNISSVIVCVHVLPCVQVDVEAIDAHAAQPIREVPHPAPEVISQSQREGEGKAAV